MSNKELVIISTKDISVQLELKCIQAQNLAIKRIHCRGHVLFRIALSWLDVWFSGGCHNCPSLSLVSAFSSYCFYRSFSPWSTAHFFFFSLQPLFDGIRLRPQNFPRIQWAIFVAGARRPEVCLLLVGGMTQLSAALMRCDKLSKL